MWRIKTKKMSEPEVNPQVWTTISGVHFKEWAFLIEIESRDQVNIGLGIVTEITSKFNRSLGSFLDPGIATILVR